MRRHAPSRTARREAPGTLAARLAPVALAAAILFAAPAAGDGGRAGEPAAQPRGGAVAAPVAGYELVREYPHDPRAFTQGLIYRDGFLYESTGLNGRSSLRKVRLETGEVVQRHDVAEQYFAEGLTDWGGSLVQLTYRSGLGFVYDLPTFERRRTFAYGGEGWGLTRDRRRLIMSDGSTRLRFLDPETFAELGHVEVTDGPRAIDDLNELELVDGLVYANVWFENRIAVIDPADGRVARWIDLGDLPARMTPAPDVAGGAVLNGIAYDAAGGRLFVTGKLWPRVFEIRVRGPR